GGIRDVGGEPLRHLRLRREYCIGPLPPDGACPWPPMQRLQLGSRILWGFPVSPRSGSRLPATGQAMIAPSAVGAFARLFSGRDDAYGSWEGGCVRAEVTTDTY